MKRIAIFASGSGTNAEKLIQYFEFHKRAQVTLVVCNNEKAGVVEIAKEHGVETLLIAKEEFFSENSIVDELKVRGIDLIVLAGFLWLIPEIILRKFPDSIINIHPALLPKFGGKGMFGNKVHDAVIAAGEKESGITVHFVNEKFDEGKHIAQFTCPVLPGDTSRTLAARVQELEHKYFAEVVEKIIS
ncbi:MAG: phosphoribosylglycinamide formyltransferase [Bacteroidetes bacterium]|nr:phosphoribosylglycinamide formyltransferase [Bacteroidota bacterium]